MKSWYHTMISSQQGDRKSILPKECSIQLEPNSESCLPLRALPCRSATPLLGEGMLPSLKAQFDPEDICSRMIRRGGWEVFVRRGCLRMVWPRSHPSQTIIRAFSDALMVWRNKPARLVADIFGISFFLFFIFFIFIFTQFQTPVTLFSGGLWSILCFQTRQKLVIS